MKSLNEVHANISEIQSRDVNGITRISLKLIPEIPEKHWPTLKAQLFSGQVQVREMTTSSISFRVFAAPGEIAGFKYFNVLAILLPVLAVILAIVYSWWFALLSLGSVWLFRVAKSFYRMAIFQGVTASEVAFCFLFSRNTICLLEDGRLVYRKNA